MGDLGEHETPSSADEFFSKIFTKSYISRKHKICYAVVCKSASTTIRRWFVFLEGIADAVESQRRIQAHSIVKQFPELSLDDAYKTIEYNKVVKSIAPHIIARSSEEKLNIFSSSEYFRFTVVRNPYTRIFSAWVDKVFGDNLAYKKYFCNDPFYYKIVTTVEDIAENFELFLTSLHKNRYLLYKDAHWIPQIYMVRTDKVTYDCIAKLEEPNFLNTALEERFGTEVPPLLREQYNKNPLAFSANFLTPRAQKLIQELYRDDFRAFSYNEIPPTQENCATRSEIERALRDILERRLQWMMKKRKILNGRLGYYRRHTLQGAYWALRGRLQKILGAYLRLP